MNPAGAQSFSLMTGLLQMFAALAVVVGIILLFYYISNRWLKIGSANGGRERHIRLVESRYLAPKKSLLLVEVGGEYLLLSNSGDRLTFIKQIDILEEIEVLDEDPAANNPLAGLGRKMAGLLGRLGNGRGSAEAGLEQAVVEMPAARGAGSVVSFNEALVERERKIRELSEWRRQGMGR